MLPDDKSERRCRLRYRIQMKRAEPFDVTYRCGRSEGHDGACAADDGEPFFIPPTADSEQFGDSDGTSATPICHWELDPESRTGKVFNDWLEKEGRSADDLERDLWVPIRQLERELADAKDDCQRLHREKMDALYGPDGLPRTPSATKEPERLPLANAIVAMKPEWAIGEESAKAWREFVKGFQSGRLTVVCTPPEEKRKVEWACGWTGDRCLRMDCTKSHPCMPSPQRYETKERP